MRIRPLIALLVVAAAGCGDGDNGRAVNQPDSAVVDARSAVDATTDDADIVDAGADAAPAEADASPTAVDAATDPADASPAPADASPDSADASPGPTDPGFAFGFGASGTDVAMDLAADASGNVTLAAWVVGDVSIAGRRFPAAGGNDGLIAQVDADGRLRWGHRIATDGFDLASSVAVGPDGAVAAVGTLGGAFDFGGGLRPTFGAQTSYVVVYDTDGRHRWSTTFGGDWSIVRDVAIGASGEVYVFGEYGTNFTIGDRQLTTAPGRAALFVARLSAASGTLTWLFRLGHDETHDTAVALATDRDHVYLLGRVAAQGNVPLPVDLGSGITLNARDTHTLVAGLDRDDGTIAWSQLAPAGYEAAGLAAHDGELVLVGEATRHLVVTRLAAADGAQRWSASYGERGPSHAAVAVRADGSILVSMEIHGDVDLGGGPLPRVGLGDTVVLELAADGAYRAAGRWGVPLYFASPRAVAAGTTGSAFVAGMFWEQIRFPAGTLTSNGDFDAFVARVPLTP